MPKVLFTKKLELEIFRKSLGTKYLLDTLDFISTSTTKPKTLLETKDKSFIFSSKNAVKSFFENYDFTETNRHIFCVGESTEAYLNALGIAVTQTKKNAEELADDLILNHSEKSFVHFCSNLVLPTLGQRLGQCQIGYQQQEIYHTWLLYPKIEQEYDVLVFFSPSGVRSFAQHNGFGNALCFALGSTTGNEILKYTSNTSITDNEMTLPSLLNTMKSYFDAQH